jgi:hypothetical protein
MVTPNIELNFPRQFVDRGAIILMAVDVMEDSGAGKPGQHGQDLKLNVSFRIQMTARVGVFELTTGGKAFDEALAVSVEMKCQESERKLEVLMEVVEAQKCRKHPIGFRAKQAGVIPEGATTSGGKDGVGHSKDAAKGPTKGEGASVGSKKYVGLRLENGLALRERKNEGDILEEIACPNRQSRDILEPQNRRRKWGRRRQGPAGFRGRGQKRGFGEQIHRSSISRKDSDSARGDKGKAVNRIDGSFPN